MSSNQPDIAATVIGHGVVALVVGALVAKSSGPVPGVVAAIIGVAAHDWLDAPVVKAVSELGI